MKIGVLEDKIESLKGSNMYSIVELLVEAVREFPLLGLDDTDLYIGEVKKLLKSNLITSDLLKNFISNNSISRDERNIWILTSMSSLLEVFSLMEMYNISLGEIQQKIRELE